MAGAGYPTGTVSGRQAGRNVPAAGHAEERHYEFDMPSLKAQPMEVCRPASYAGSAVRFFGSGSTASTLPTAALRDVHPRAP